MYATAMVKIGICWRDSLASLRIEFSGGKDQRYVISRGIFSFQRSMPSMLLPQASDAPLKVIYIRYLIPTLSELG